MAALYEPFTVHISSITEHKIGDDVECEVTITNNDGKDYYLLVRHTPLEGLRSDIFIVSTGGWVIPYDSIMVKRGPPSAKECVLIKAKSSLKSSVDLSHAHSFDSTGDHTVQLKMTLKFHEDKPTRFLDSTQRVVSNTMKFSLTGSQKEAKLTKGARVRKMQPAPRLAQPPKLAGHYRNTSQKRDTEEAYNLAYPAIGNSIASTTDNLVQYKEWFGKPYRSTVKSNYTTMETTMERKQFTLHAYPTHRENEDICEEGEYAFTYKGHSTIYLCREYFNAPLTGTNSKMGTIVHEMSHAASGTDDVQIHGDYIYGQDGCRRLAVNHPGLAVKNADNYEYFSEAQF